MLKIDEFPIRFQSKEGKKTSQALASPHEYKNEYLTTVYDPIKYFICQPKEEKKITRKLCSNNELIKNDILCLIFSSNHRTKKKSFLYSPSSLVYTSACRLFPQKRRKFYN